MVFFGSDWFEPNRTDTKVTILSHSCTQVVRAWLEHALRTVPTRSRRPEATTGVAHNVNYGARARV